MATRDEKNDFFAAMQNFAGAVQTFRYNDSLKDFSEQQQALEAELRPEAEKRAMQTQLADNAFLNAISFGKDVQTASVLASRFAPPVYNNVETALLSGDPAAQAAAANVLKEQEDRRLREMQSQASISEASQSRLFNQQDAAQSRSFNQQMTMQERRDQAAFDRAQMAAGQQASRVEIKPATPHQYKAAGFASRVVQAEADFSRLAAAGYKGNSIVDKATNLLPNTLQSAEKQQFRQAQENFVTAVLRIESGAAISEEEFSRAQLQYFPQPGDSQAVINQKARNRALVRQNLASEAGPAWDKMSSRLPGAANVLGNSVTDLQEGLKPKVPAKSYIKRSN